MPLINELHNNNLLTKCWRSVYNGKSEDVRARSKGMDNISLMDFKLNKEIYLSNILSELKNYKYKFWDLKGYPGKKEKKGKYRLITVATVSNRIIHKAVLSQIITPIFPYINTGVSYCGVKESIWKRKGDSDSLNTKMAIKKMTSHISSKNYFIFKSDIKGFYDNIPKRRLYNIVKKLSVEYLRDESLNPILKKIIFFHLGNKNEFENEKLRSLLPKKHYGISQGSPLSQFFANIYLADFDLKMKISYGDKFIRYIDDFVVICSTDEEAREARSYATRILNQKGLELSLEHQKTYCIDIRKSALKFLGLKICKDMITSKKTKEEINKWINELLDENNAFYYRTKDHWLPMSERIIIMNNKIKGQENYLLHYHTQEYFKLINKRINHKKKISRSIFNKLITLRSEKISPIIPLDEWKQLFN